MPAARASAIIFLALTASAVVAITAATALVPSHAGVALAAPQPAQSKSAQARPHAAVTPATAAESDPEAKRFSGRVGNDLSSSLIAAGVPDAQGREYVNILGRAIQLADGLSVDDKFDLVVQRTADGKLGQILYVGLDRVARADVELLKWTDGKNVIWVNADGVGGEDQSRMGLPVHGRLTSGFGERFHPILGYTRFHKGADLAAPAGTPIVAAADGKVVGAGWHGGYGQLVRIAHADGLETTYGHRSRFAARGNRLCRFDRPVDGPACPFRSHPQRPPGQPAER